MLSAAFYPLEGVATQKADLYSGRVAHTISRTDVWEWPAYNFGRRPHPSILCLGGIPGKRWKPHRTNDGEFDRIAWTEEEARQSRSARRNVIAPALQAPGGSGKNSRAA